MNPKRWLFLWTVIIAILTVATEINFKYFKKQRHIVDYLVDEYVPSITNTQGGAVILGDSVANNAFAKLENINGDIIDLTSNGAISLAGNYFLLQRFMARNNPGSVYLVATPELFYNTLTGSTAYLYVETVFMQPEEISSIKALAPNFYHKEHELKLNRYFESRRNGLNFSSRFKQKSKHKAENIDSATLDGHDDFRMHLIDTAVSKQIGRINTVDSLPKVYLEKIVALCEARNIPLTIVIGPSPIGVTNAFKQSDWYEYLSSLDLALINIGDIYQFSNYWFRRDGFHLSPRANKYYQNLLNEHVLKLY
jgi:hypothetical protein